MNIIIWAAAPSRGEIKYREGYLATNSSMAGNIGGTVWEKIHIREAAGSAANHFSNSEFSAITDKVLANPLSFGRPYITFPAKFAVVGHRHSREEGVMAAWLWALMSPGIRAC